MLDSTLGLERSGSKIYPESLENKRAPKWRANRSTVKMGLAALTLLEILKDRVTKRGNTRHRIKQMGGEFACLDFFINKFCFVSRERQ